MGGKIYTPFGAWYHATKHALEGWSDSLRIELKQFGIDVVIVEPGGIQTEWGDIAMKHLQETSGTGPYADSVKKVVNGMEKSANSLTHVDILGKEIARAATDNKPKTRYVKGYMAKPAISMRKWFGDRFFDKMLSRQLS